MADVRPPAPHGASPEGPVGGMDFAGPDFDWKTVALDTVRKYPIPCVLGAAAVGFWIGRYRGRAITAALAGLATNAVLRELNRVFEGQEP